jgi:predicted AAA+ superfamily ATPase
LLLNAVSKVARKPIQLVKVKIPPKQNMPWYQYHNHCQAWRFQNFGSLIVLALAALWAITMFNQFISKIQNTAHTLKTANSNEFVLHLQSAIETSTITRIATDESQYVRRNYLENTITSFVDNSPGMQYLILYGPRGIGKSSVVEHALRNRAGVIRLTLDTVLTNTFQVTAGQHSAKVRKAKLITALAAARHTLPRRVVVVDVPSSISMRANAVM